MHLYFPRPYLVLLRMAGNQMAPSSESQIFFLLFYIFPSTSRYDYKVKQTLQKDKQKELSGITIYFEYSI